MVCQLGGTMYINFKVSINSFVFVFKNGNLEYKKVVGIDLYIRYSEESKNKESQVIGYILEEESKTYREDEIFTDSSDLSNYVYKLANEAKLKQEKQKDTCVTDLTF